MRSNLKVEGRDTRVQVEYRFDIPVRGLEKEECMLNGKKKAMAGETRAMLEIWNNWDKFVAAAAANKKESAALAAIALSGDSAAIRAQMKKVGDTCGKCHFSFRYP